MVQREIRVSTANELKGCKEKHFNWALLLSADGRADTDRPPVNTRLTTMALGVALYWIFKFSATHHNFYEKSKPKT